MHVKDALDASEVQVVDSYRVCKAWVYVLDKVIWPLQNASAHKFPITTPKDSETTQLWYAITIKEAWPFKFVGYSLVIVLSVMLKSQAGQLSLHRC